MTKTFDTGATRNDSAEKLDFEGFLSPLALEALGAYMNFHRHLEDGSLRDSDNWQKGIPLVSYIKSLWRHFFDVWRAHRGNTSTPEGIVFGLCGVLFNAQGYLHEYLKANPEALAIALGAAEQRKRSLTTLSPQISNRKPTWAEYYGHYGRAPAMAVLPALKRSGEADPRRHQKPTSRRR